MIPVQKKPSHHSLHSWNILLRHSPISPQYPLVHYLSLLDPLDFVHCYSAKELLQVQLRLMGALQMQMWHMQLRSAMVHLGFYFAWMPLLASSVASLQKAKKWIENEKMIKNTNNLFHTMVFA